MKTWVALSGGVDSSIAAFLVHQTDPFAEGVMLRLTGDTPDTRRDEADARRVAAQLGMPFRLLTEENHFRKEVICPFAEAYAAGETPNPCIFCNRRIKFGLLLERAREAGFDTVATGHYARVEKDEKSDRFLLKKAADSRKDQSYMLYSLSQEQLSHVSFPLAGRTKAEIQSLAETLALPTARKKESQDICFVPDGHYADCVEDITGKHFPEGDFTDAAGHILGRHRGYIHYTIGQRRGLGIASEAPLYVTDILPEENRVVLSHSEGLFKTTVLADRLNFIDRETLDGSVRVMVRLRYHQTEQAASARIENGLLRLDFDTPQRAVTPGQAAVLYQGDTVIGGGTILRDGGN